MAQTVIGLFKNDGDAQSAAGRLQVAGIAEDNIDISSGSEYGNNSTESEKKGNGISRFFKSLFGDDSDDAARYSNAGNKGYSIVTVHATSAEEAQKAADLLDEYGAMDMDEETMMQGSDNSGQTIQRVEEELQVGKREVEAGGVRLRSRIVEKPVEETVRLRSEHVRVQRQAVNRPLTDGDRTAFQDQDIVLTEKAEVPVVNKEARVVEEIRLNKDVDERSETIRDTVRHTEVDIDNMESNKRSKNSL